MSLFNSGTRWGAGDLPGRDLRRPFLRGSPQCQFRAPLRHLQRAQEVHEVPGILRLDNIDKGRHRCTVQAGHKNLVEVLIGHSALEARASGKVVRADGLIVAVGEGRSRWAVPEAFLTVALPAFQLLEEFLAMLDALHGELRLRWNTDRIARLVILPPSGERLDEGDQIGAVLGRQSDPRRHV